MEYTIKAGDNLSKIAQVNNTTVSALSSANNIANPNIIQVGKTLKIPTATLNANVNNLTNPGNLQGSIQTPPVPPVNDQIAATNAQLYLNSQANVDNALAPYETANKSIIDQYKEQSGMLVNKNADLNNFNNTLDTQGIGTVNSNKKQAIDLANQILANKTQGQVQQLDKGRLGGLTVGGAQNIDEEINRQTAIKNLTLGAQLTAAQGNLALAQDLVTQSIDAKYAPIEAKLANLKNYYDMNQTELTRVDKKAFQSQQLSLAAQQKDLEAKKKNDTDIQTILVNASSQNAPASLVAKAAKAKNPGEAAMILGQYAGDYYKTELLKNQIQTEKAQRAKIYSDIAANGGGSTGSAGVVGVQGINPLKFKDAGARTNFEKATGVIEQVDTVLSKAQKDASGNYYGLGYFGGNKPEVFLDQAGQTNRGLLAGLRLKTQMWASGASLTSQQIAEVEKLVPKETDADSTITRKLNGLRTVMENEQKSIASTQGQRVVEPKEPNIFEQAQNPNAGNVIPGTSIIKNVSGDGNIIFDVPNSTKK